MKYPHPDDDIFELLMLPHYLCNFVIKFLVKHTDDTVQLQRFLDAECSV